MIAFLNCIIHVHLELTFNCVLARDIIISSGSFSDKPPILLQIPKYMYRLTIELINVQYRGTLLD